MKGWIETLYRELDQWNYDGVAATFWWRDDDAQAPSAELDRLLELAQKHHAPLALAVIPQGMDGNALAEQVKPLPTIAILQHGFSHANHAPPDQKKAELGEHRDLATIHRELASGITALRNAFGEQFVAVLVPPWNRIAPSVLGDLAQIGFIGLSTFQPRPARQPAPGIWAVNTHLDLIHWKQGRTFIGESAATEALVAHLRSRRHGHHDSSEPTGLLTHHQTHPPACWNFLAELLAALDDHPAVKWQTAHTAFGGIRN